ncbi:Hint domain-containing protein [Thalassococcus sp. CAU 1522]|uniref:Hint domain-containing protein n=1 Tax=Thalassococcus arenae TaxID=2851652 RepID=A0ABS6NCS0_9RHOB|nr:Hint domain-containing protein [Thalassococcus arenae]MBV2361374.1 Hint domain-containing protein [Thalassococcus arenae]
MEPKTVRRETGQRSARHIDSDTALNALVAGTVVLTLDGALPVEYLNPGDRVITRDSGMAVLRAVRRMRLRVPAVSIGADTLGNARPDADVVLPANQEVLVRDWRAQALFGAERALVPAARLVDGEYIRHLGPVDLDLVALVFDAPHILYADGLEVAAAAPETVSA